MDWICITEHTFLEETRIGRDSSILSHPALSDSQFYWWLPGARKPCKATLAQEEVFLKFVNQEDYLEHLLKI